MKLICISARSFAALMFVTVVSVCSMMVGCSSGTSPVVTPPTTPTTTAPVFAPGNGTYASAQSVTITDATAGAKIFYTIDGTTPTTSSTAYTAPVVISTTTTLEAIATASGANNSIVVSVVITITPPVATATPTFSPAAGTYTSAQSVTISDATAGATTFYTTDGTTPTTSSTTYTAPIAVSTTTTIQAIATATGATTSSVASAVFTITPPPVAPTFSPAAGTYTSAQSVTLSTASAGAKIYYTTDGSTPTTSSTLYSAPISVSTSEVITAIASLNGQVSSVASGAYVLNIPPTALSAYSGGGQSIQVESGFSEPLEVQVFSAGNVPLAGATVSFAAPTSGPSVDLSSSSCVTDSNGLCSITARANAALGTYTVTASVASLNAAFTLTNTGLHSYLVTVLTDTTTGVASNCLDQATSASAANAACSLRDALAAAATNASNSATATVTFAQTSVGTITLVNGSLAIPAYTTIQGATSGSGTTLTNLIAVDGANLSSVLTEATGVTQASLNNLTITHGNSSVVGGGIYMLGSLSVNNSTFIANQATDSGGAISNNGGTLTVFGSTFQNNTAIASGGFGGGIDNYDNGTLTISNSTFYGNQGYNGGGVYSSGTANIVDSTIVGNTGSYGAGIYNKGTAITIARSIVNGNTNEDCGGVYCDTQWSYVLFSSATASPIDSSSITIAFTDTFGNSFSQTASYGSFSSPASIAATFGPYFFSNTSGLDTTGITGESFGSLLVISPENGATLNPFTITNPGSSFTATQVTNASPLATNNNVYGAAASVVNLAPLGNNGGPTQTMLPLTGSSALCVVTPSSETGTDQRGQPRVATVGTTTCQDAGAVQTSN